MSDEPAGADARIAKLSHDLRTPLTIIRGFADLLVRKPEPGEAERSEYARRISDAAADAVRLLDEEREERRVRTGG